MECCNVGSDADSLRAGLTALREVEFQVPIESAKAENRGVTACSAIHGNYRISIDCNAGPRPVVFLITNWVKKRIIVVSECFVSNLCSIGL